MENNYEEITTIEEETIDVEEEETSCGAGLVLAGVLTTGAAIFGGVKLVKHLKAKKAAKEASDSDASGSAENDSSDSKKDSKKK